MHRPEVGEDVLAAVREHQRDPLARRQAKRGEPGRRLEHPPPGLLPGHGPPATAACRVGLRRSTRRHRPRSPLPAAVHRRVSGPLSRPRSRPAAEQCHWSSVISTLVRTAAAAAGRTRRRCHDGIIPTARTRHKARGACVTAMSGRGCDNGLMRLPVSTRPQRSSPGSLLSIGSSGSILSIGSTGSILSIGSAGSILSIGSAGSFASVLSVCSFASVGSVLSGLSRWSFLAWRSRGPQ